MLLPANDLRIARIPKWAYNAAMRRALILAFLFGGIAFAATDQVRVNVPTLPYNYNDTIPAKVENHSSEPITFCVDFGQRSVDGNIVEHTPIPFAVQAESQNVWLARPVGLNAGTDRRSEVVRPGRSGHFPFRPGVSGRLRLLLDYWIGSMPELDCANPPAGAHKIKSTPFDVTRKMKLE